MDSTSFFFAPVGFPSLLAAGGSWTLERKTTDTASVFSLKSGKLHSPVRFVLYHVTFVYWTVVWNCSCNFAKFGNLLALKSKWETP